MVNKYKVVLCGKTGVGKTSIFRRLCGQSNLNFQQSAVKTTRDHECCITTKVEGETVELNLWDTLGLEQHATYTRSHFLLSQAVLIVYSATDKDSLSQAVQLLTLAKIHAQGACFILVRNKIDLEPSFNEDELHEEMASVPDSAFALQFRTSALTGEGIQEMLEKMAIYLLKKATPMKSLGRHSLCTQGCYGVGASYSRDGTAVVQLQFEEKETPPRRRRKCCHT